MDTKNLTACYCQSLPGTLCDFCSGIRKPPTFTPGPRSKAQILRDLRNLEELRPAEKHTPAPWRYEQATKTIRSWPANCWLATMNSFDGCVNHAANARLIATAPELLAACIGILNHIKNGDLVLSIEKDGEPSWAMRMTTLVKTLQDASDAIAKAIKD